MLFDRRGERSCGERGYDEFDYYGDEPFFYDEPDFLNFADITALHRIENKKQKKNRNKSGFFKKK